MGEKVLGASKTRGSTADADIPQIRIAGSEIQKRLGLEAMKLDRPRIMIILALRYDVHGWAWLLAGIGNYRDSCSSSNRDSQGCPKWQFSLPMICFGGKETSRLRGTLSGILSTFVSLTRICPFLGVETVGTCQGDACLRDEFRRSTCFVGHLATHSSDSPRT